MSKKILFWLIVVPIFIDFFAGGISYLIMGDYWGYQPLPIMLMQGAGFTYGFSLILLVPYIAILYILFQVVKILGEKYKKIVLILILSIIILHSFGFTSQIIRTSNREKNLKQKEVDHEIIEVQFNNDVLIKNLQITTVPKEYNTFQAKFSVIIPSKYIPTVKTTLGIGVLPNDDLYSANARFDLFENNILNQNSQSHFEDYDGIKPRFNVNGDLIIDVTLLFIDSNDEHGDESKKMNINITLDPEGSNLFNSNYSELNYAKSIMIH